MAQQGKDPSLSLYQFRLLQWRQFNPDPGTYACLRYDQKKEKKERKGEFPLWLSKPVKNPTSIHEDVGLIPGLTQ